MPAGLTYSGFSGAGWLCSVSGQDVTCTKSGALAAGQSATPLVLNVNVAAGLNGVITNSAIVSGTGVDGNSANDTATDTYVILPQPYAYYAMDEATNATSVRQHQRHHRSTGPKHNDEDRMRLPGTRYQEHGWEHVPFWYAGSAAWNDTNPRMLFDASVDGGAAADRHFFLVKDGTGG